MKKQKAKIKCMKQLDTKSLTKRVHIAQDTTLRSSTVPDVSRIGTIMRTIYISLCICLIGIPHEVLTEGARIGSGVFGEVKEHITYCGKLYKGDSLKMFDNRFHTTNVFGFK